jgi:transcriptional regulator with XRE-family HTH domain
MFWNIYNELCKSKNTSPNAVAAALGLSNATCTKWKQGATPGGKNLQKIADYFGVTTGYLLGEKPDTPTPATDDPLTAEVITLTEILSRTETGIARLKLFAEDLRRAAELERLTAELEAAKKEKPQE